MPVPSASLTASGRKSAAIRPKPSLPRQSPASIKPARARTVVSKYLMNDIPRGTTRTQLMSCLQPVDSRIPLASNNRRIQVDGSCIISDSRLDDELSVAVIEFSNTPAWLQHLNQDVCGFPKKTVLGTLWRGVDTHAVDELGRTEFIRAAIDGDLLYAETLAEFSDTDINAQDNQRRTALHWACAENHIDLVKLCLSIPECDVGLKDSDSLTAFDIALERDEKMIIPALFYQNLMDMDERHPQTALLRMLTMTSAPVEDKVVFPGGAIFEPIEDSNTPLVKALIERGIDHTVRNSSGDTALHVAAKSSEVEIAIRLMNAGSDVDAKGTGGATPLHYAVQKSEKQMVQALLSWEAKPDAMDDNGKTPLELAKDAGMVRHELDRMAKDAEKRTPLHRATEDGDVYMVGLLLELGVPVDEGNTTALMCAARMGHRDIGKLLLDAGANLAATDNEGQTALQMATEPDFTQLLRNRVATITRRLAPERLPLGLHLTSNTESQLVNDTVGHEDVTSLVQAARSGDLRKVLSLLNSGANIEQRDGKDRTALHRAAEYGHAPVIHALLDRGARLDVVLAADGGTALHMAAAGGHSTAIEALLAGRADIQAADATGATPLHIAAENGHTEAVQALIAGGANVQAARSGMTSLYISSGRGHTQIVLALLVGGADIEAAWAGMTSLHNSSGRGHTQTVLSLLAGGADIETVCSKMTPLYMAARNGQTETVQALLASGANVEAETLSGERSLHIAAGSGHTETVQALLAGGANVEAVLLGATALHYAAQSGRTETVKALLLSGADFTRQDPQHRTALWMAIKHGHRETANALRAARVAPPFQGSVGRTQRERQRKSFSTGSSFQRH